MISHLECDEKEKKNINKFRRTCNEFSFQIGFIFGSRGARGVVCPDLEASAQIIIAPNKAVALYFKWQAGKGVNAFTQPTFVSFVLTSMS